MHIETNMRFSFRNKEEGGESYLHSDVKQKLDYIITLEEMLVPSLIPKNISLAITFGGKFLEMIKGLAEMMEQNLNINEASQKLVSFQKWMKRFIVTNYELFLDFFKTHSEFVA